MLGTLFSGFEKKKHEMMYWRFVLNVCKRFEVTIFTYAVKVKTGCVLS